MVSLLAAAAMQSALVIPNPRVLVFSRTLEFRHDSIPNAIEAIKKLGAEHGFQVDATEDSAAFTDQNLEKYDLLCFASTTGDILNEEQHKVLVRFVENGKGWMGIHAASDTEHHWPWYRDLVGAYFKTHPAGGAHVKVQIENRGNPSTANLPNLWIRPDEWYDWDANPRANVQVLASLDESFYRPENPQDHPITWCHWQGKG
ncbi:MAG: ThuA domain-containing protein, partial [Armatimonadota bacterium]